jgi:hypothetical protein
MTAALPAFALGLGDLTVTSRLGQPLNAEIALLGPAGDLNPDCFRIVSPNGTSLALPSDISVQVEQSGEHANLRIQTRQSINEPAFLFKVAVVCPERIQRDYAALIDPPAAPTFVPVVVDKAKTITDSNRESVDSSKPSAKANRPESSVTIGHAGLANRKAAARRPAKHLAVAPTSDGPKLILSGGRRTYSPASAQLALFMDVSVLDLSRKAEVPLAPTELTDENTALSRKVAHLEDLLGALQKRNAELEQARAKAAEKGHPVLASATKKPPERSNWLYFMAGFVLLASGVAYALYRRRQQKAVEQYSETELWRATAVPLSKSATGVRQEQGSTSKAPNAEQPAEPAAARAETSLSSAPGEGTEVKDSVADEVEVFVAHGHSDLAIHMLEDHIEKAPEESPVPWLLLLDLLRREGAESRYENYRQKCKLHFNVAMPAYSEAEMSPGDHGLESFVHIMSELVRLWPTDQANAYLDDLIYDRRGGSRMGFDPATYRDIVLLKAIRIDSPRLSLA